MTTPQAPLIKPLHSELREIPLDALEGVTHTARSTTTRAVAALGLTSAILVTPTGTAEAPRYRVLDGSRRVRDALAAGMTHIPAIVSEGDTRDLLAASLTANLCRSANAADQAATLRALAAESGGLTDDTLRAIARETGINVQALRKTARLLALPDDLIAEVGARLSPGVAAELAALPESVRPGAVAAARDKLASDPKARFTGDDLKAARVAKTDALAALAAGALAAAPQAPLAFATPREIAVNRALQAAKSSGVTVAELIAGLREIGEAQ